MKIILKHRWYTMKEDWKKIVMMLVLAITCLCAYFYATGECFPIYIAIATLPILTMTISTSMRKKEETRQWDKFSLTLPLERKQVVKAEYCFFLQLNSMIFLSLMFLLMLFSEMGQILDTETNLGAEVFLIMAPLSFSMGVFGSALIYLMSLKCQGKSIEIFQIMVIALSISLFSVLILLDYTALEGSFRSFLSVGGFFIPLFFTLLCYPLSQRFMKQKEF